MKLSNAQMACLLATQAYLNKLDADRFVLAPAPESISRPMLTKLAELGLVRKEKGHPKRTLVSLTLRGKAALAYFQNKPLVIVQADLVKFCQEPGVLYRAQITEDGLIVISLTATCPT